jgi:hypothetical protein
MGCEIIGDITDNPDPCIPATIREPERSSRVVLKHRALLSHRGASYTYLWRYYVTNFPAEGAKWALVYMTFY